MKVIRLEDFKMASKLMLEHERLNQNKMRHETLSAAKLHIVYGVPVLQAAVMAGVSREVVYRAVKKALMLVDVDSMIDLGDEQSRAKLFDHAAESVNKRREQNKTMDAAKLIYVYNVPHSEALCFVGSGSLSKSHVDKFISKIKAVFDILDQE
jgi:predicted DNA-binding protein (UPF0251 family)